MGGGTIKTFTVAVNTTGSAGSATGTGTATDFIHGYFLDAYIDYHASAPATTVVTIAQTGHADKVLTAPASATDVRIAPRQSLATRAGAAITNSHDLIPVNGTLTVAVSASDALTAAATVTMRVLTF